MTNNNFKFAIKDNKTGLYADWGKLQEEPKRHETRTICENKIAYVRKQGYLLDADLVIVELN